MTINNKTILIIDDETNLAGLIKHELAAKGYSVILASDGQEGINKLKIVTPDLIILDINMPGMSGLEFYRRIMTSDGQAMFPVLVLTSRAEFQEVFDDIHAAGFLPKPFHMTELLTKVDDILKTS